MPRPTGAVPPLTLYGCWEVCALMGDPPPIVRQIELLENAVSADPAIALDIAKSLIESVCKTVLRERGVTPDSDWKFNQLVRYALNAVRIVPDGLPPELARAMSGLGAGMVTVAQQLGELRNAGGLIGHGRAAQERFVEVTHALYAARSADALVHLLYVAHVAETGGPSPRPPRLDDHEAFNDYADTVNPIEIFGIPYRASEILFRVDPVAYQDQLTEYEAREAVGEGEATETEVAEPSPPAPPQVESDTPETSPAEVTTVVALPEPPAA